MQLEPITVDDADETLTPTFADLRKLLTAEQVAVRLEVPPSWVNKAARSNRLPHIRVGRYRRFRWPDIEAWLEQQRAGS
jgi:excisionase family DNA binding protein